MFNWFTKKSDPGKKEIYEKSYESALLETFNPLKGLTIERAGRIYDTARMGAYAELQWLYQELEGCDPTLLTCCERRSTAMLEIDWTIKTTAQEKTRNFDEILANEQKDFLTLAYAESERGNLAESLEHLASSFFRGFAHARPVYGEGMDCLAGFECLDAWNFCRDTWDGTWYWNPDASTSPANAIAIPRNELVSVVRPRHINYPALQIVIRRMLGDTKYGIFLERYGVPPVIITMPPDIDKGDEERYVAAANDVAKGGSGTVPNGSIVEYATDARGVNPFSDFLKRQQELIVLMATGGLLTSLSGEGGMGSGGASDAHEKTWRSIVRRDCRVIATPLNRIVTADLLAAKFPGRPHLAYFDFTDPQPTANEIFDTASKAFTAGYRVSKDDLEEKTGYTLEVAEATGIPSVPGQPVQAVAQDAAASVADTALNGAQISSLVELLSSAAAKTLPMESLLPILNASFPTIPEATLTQIVAPLRGFTPPKTDELPTGSAMNKQDPFAKQPNPVAKREEASEAKEGAEKGAPPVESILEGLAVKTEEELYGVFLDAAVDAAQKGLKK